MNLPLSSCKSRKFSAGRFVPIEKTRLGPGLWLRNALLAFAGTVLFCAGSLAAQNQTAAAKASSPNSKASSHPDFSGFWERKDLTGSGSFDGLDKNIPRAEVTPEVARAAKEEQQHQAAGYVVSRISRWCLDEGMPFIMGHSSPLDIVQSKDEILIIPEPSHARHIYMVGQAAETTSSWDASVNGNSIGHWEGDTLVVETTGFRGDEGGVPGGGRRTRSTHLVERFRLVDGGKKLSVTSTWTDPKIYVKPHTYEYVYYKDPPDTYAFEEFCDPSDPAQAGSVVPPPQN